MSETSNEKCIFKQSTIKWHNLVKNPEDFPTAHDYEFSSWYLCAIGIVLNEQLLVHMVGELLYSREKNEWYAIVPDKALENNTDFEGWPFHASKMNNVVMWANLPEDILLAK